MTAPKLVALTANTSWYLYNFRGNLIKALLEPRLAIAPQDAYSERLSGLGDNPSFQHISIDQGGTNPLRDFMTTVGFYRLYRQHPRRLPVQDSGSQQHCRIGLGIH